jgi:DNA polymerase-3 subunit delta
VLLLVATKLHGQRRLVTTAKKGGFIVTCEPLARQALPGWIERAARDRGHSISLDVAELLAEIAGPELGYVDDAIERLSLFVGANNPIDEDAVATCVTRVRQSSVWDLIDAIGRRKVGNALGTLAECFDPRDGGLRLLGAVTWSIRQMVKLDSALKSGASLNEAASQAGVPPFRAQPIAQVVRSLPPGALGTWLRLLAETDLALKGSKRPAQAVLETMIIDMCA